MSTTVNFSWADVESCPASTDEAVRQVMLAKGCEYDAALTTLLDAVARAGREADFASVQAHLGLRLSRDEMPAHARHLARVAQPPASQTNPLGEAASRLAAKQGISFSKALDIVLERGLHKDGVA